MESVFTPLALPDQPADNPGLYFVALNYSDGVNAIDLTQHKQFPDMAVGDSSVIADEAELQKVGLGNGIKA